MKRVRWPGSSKEDLIKFPKAIRADIGFGIDRLQRGLDPLDWKPLLPGGIFEIRARDNTGAYRVAYFLKLKDEVVVIHCFKKKSQKTPKKELEIIKQRISEFKQ